MPPPLPDPPGLHHPQQPLAGGKQHGEATQPCPLCPGIRQKVRGGAHVKIHVKKYVTGNGEGDDEVKCQIFLKHNFANKEYIFPTCTINCILCCLFSFQNMPNEENKHKNKVSKNNYLSDMISSEGMVM